MQPPALVELATKRNSFQNPRPGAVDIHDPSWIPVLADKHPSQSVPREAVEKELSPYSTSTFPAFSAPTAQRASQSQAHGYTRSSLAPESVAAATGRQTTPSNEHNTEPPRLPPLPPSPTKFELPAGRPTSEYFQHKSISLPSREEVKDESTDTDGTVESVGDQSTLGTASLLDEQTYSIPGQPLSAKDDVAVLPPLPLSTHSSFSSLRKAALPTAIVPVVPTSKYSRKPVAGRNSTLASPQDSSVSPAYQELPSRLSSASLLQQAVQTLPSPNGHSHSPSTALAKSPLSTNLQQSKSSASQRRGRALNSHPSSNSLAPRRNSSSSDVDVPVVPAPVPQPRSRPPSHRARKSTDSRINRNPSCASLAPSPAPTTPLPRLPPHALTSDPESEGMPKPPPEAHVSNEKSSNTRADHSQMASFMTTTQTMIFRRFDDVHVQLLLCLQDEISELERKLNDLDGTSMTRNDRTLERMQVLRELRRVVGEYDQLFASWSSMQATKAPKSTLANLKHWLERPQTSAGAGLGRGAQEDLMWLDGAKDLSSVNLGTSKPEKEQKSSAASGMGKRPGVFSSCAGKRK